MGNLNVSGYGYWQHLVKSYLFPCLNEHFLQFDIIYTFEKLGNIEDELKITCSQYASIASIRE